MALQRIDGGDLWKTKVPALQLRLRERFRVAVHCHRYRRSMLPDHYFSSSLRRWLRPFLSKDFVVEEDDSVIFRMLQAVAFPLIGNVCHVFMNGLNRVQVSNHVASMDDPLFITSLLPLRVLLDAQNLRWTLCATDRCFRNPVTSGFFRSVKVLPVSHGDGIYQKGMDMAISKLNSGGWVHIFPEGSRSRNGGKTVSSPKRGVGTLVLDADNIPMVLLFVHTGMQDMMPIGTNFPRIGKTVTVLVGDPINFDDLINEEVTEDVSRGKFYDSVASRTGKRLYELKVQVDRLAHEQSTPLQNNPAQVAETAAYILHQVHWETFGLGSHSCIEGNPTGQGTSTQPIPNIVPPHQEESPSDWYFRMGFSSLEAGLASRMSSYMDPTELMGFAAKGWFVNHRPKDFVATDVIYRPKGSGAMDVHSLRAWKQFLEARLLQQWNSC